MNKLFTLLLLCGYLTATEAQTYSVTFPEKVVKTIGTAVISGQFVGAESQKIQFGNQNMGGMNKPLMLIPTDKEGKFAFKYELPFKDYYFLKFENGQMLNVILHGGDSIKIYGDTKNVQQLSNFIGSEESEEMNQFLVQYGGLKKIEDSLRQVARLDPSKGTAVNAYYQPLAQAFFQKRDKFISNYSGSAALIVAVNAIDQTKEWANYEKVVTLLGRSFGESPTIKNLQAHVATIKKEKAATAFLEPGNKVKDIVMNDTEGKPLKLSDLEGKVVLIDFWASWCRPCRAENPNVVKLYNHYGKEGFEVFSVSLDANLAAWKKAIADDGLIWPSHVSDLNKWNNAAAKSYGVKSIPYTVLIDREGKVIGTNLRGV
ncbi:MAG: thiol-disulfide isomerase/thioredoxin, partial [Arenicella sp.]